MADAHPKPNHDYHLVEPSPWPLVGSIAAFVLAVGFIMWMKHMSAAGVYLFGRRRHRRALRDDGVVERRHQGG